MAIITLNGFPVSSGRLPMSLQGAWRAEVEVVADTTEGLSGPAELVLGTTVLRGTSTASIDAGGRVTAVVVAGANALGAQVPPRPYGATSRHLVLRSALAEVGEALSPTVNDPKLLAEVPSWTRLAGPAGEAVRAIARHAGLTWRHLADGSIWMGTETWPTVEPEHVLESEQPNASKMALALEGATVLPGTTFRGRRLSSVEYVFSPSAIRATASYGVERHPVADLVASQVRREAAHLDYAGVFLCEVVGQDASERLELRSTDPRCPDLSGVVIRPGMMGVTSQTVPRGSMAILAHENSDPTRPAVIGFASGSATQLTIDAALVRIGKLASAFIARADLVDANFAALPATLASGANSGGPVVFSVPFVPVTTAATKGMVE